MQLGMGFNLSAETVTEIETLLWLWARWPESRPLMSVADLFNDLPPGEARQMGNRLKAFENEGWIGLPYFSYNEPARAQCSMQPAGERLAEKLHRMRESRGEREVKAQDAALYWMYEEGCAGGALVQKAMNGYGYYLGSPFTDQEICDAGKALKDYGYLASTGTASVPWLILPVVTEKGKRLVRQKLSTVDDEQGASSISIGAQTNNTFQGGGTSNVVTGGNNVTVNNSTTINDDHRQQILSLADWLEQTQPAVAQVDPDAGRALTLAVSDLRAGIDEGSPDLARTGRGLSAITKVATQFGGAVAALNLLAANANTMMQSIGLT